MGTPAPVEGLLWSYELGTITLQYQKFEFRKKIVFFFSQECIGSYLIRTTMPRTGTFVLTGVEV